VVYVTNKKNNQQLTINMKNLHHNLRLIPFFLLLSGGVLITNVVAREVNNVNTVNPAYFTKAPRLLGASATFNSVQARGAKYYFNIELPQDAGTNLQQVAISQRQGQETIDFRLEETLAYRGTNRDRQAPLAIANIEQNEETGAITITLEKPVSPGTTFTIALKPRKNPFYDGVYLFGVTAFPQGNNPQSLYLGVGRLPFYRANDGFFRP
jgi:hypothetical protein